MESVNIRMFGNLIPHQIFLYYNIPLIYTVVNGTDIYYFHACDFHNNQDLFLVRKATGLELDVLIYKGITLKNFLQSAEKLYLVRLRLHHPADAFLTSVKEITGIDPEFWPAEGFYLMDQK